MAPKRQKRRARTKARAQVKRRPPKRRPPRMSTLIARLRGTDGSDKVAIVVTLSPKATEATLKRALKDALQLYKIDPENAIKELLAVLGFCAVRSGVSRERPLF